MTLVTPSRAGGAAPARRASTSPRVTRDPARRRTAAAISRWFEIADAASVALAVGGVLYALATVQSRRWLPTWLVRWSLWPLAAFMALRAILSMPGDVYQIVSDPSGALTHTARWDLALWSPLFLVWGLLWAAAALTYGHRARCTEAGEPAGTISDASSGSAVVVSSRRR